MPEKPVGKVEHYYPKVKAAAVRLTRKVKLGDEVHIVGHGDDVREEVTSLQLDHEPIEEGQPGQSVGLWVKDRVHEGDDVLLVTPDGPSKRLSEKPTAGKAGKAGKPRAAAAGKARPRSKARRSPPRVRRAASKAMKAPAAAARRGPRSTRKAVRQSKDKRSTTRRKSPGRGRSAARKASRKER